jgi:hypothetical protein
MHDRKLEPADTDEPSATVRLNLNPAAINAVTATVTRIGEAAEAVSRAAKAVGDAMQPASKAKRALAWAGAAGFAELLARLFHR